MVFIVDGVIREESNEEIRSSGRTAVLELQKCQWGLYSRAARANKNFRPPGGGQNCLAVTVCSCLSGRPIIML